MSPGHRGGDQSPTWWSSEATVEQQEGGKEATGTHTSSTSSAPATVKASSVCVEAQRGGHLKDIWCPNAPTSHQCCFNFLFFFVCVCVQLPQQRLQMTPQVRLSSRRARSAPSSAREPCSSPREYSGMAGWQRTSEVSCVKMKRQKEKERGRGRLARAEGRRGERGFAPIGGDGYGRRIPSERSGWGEIVLTNHAAERDAASPRAAPARTNISRSDTRRTRREREQRW